MITVALKERDQLIQEVELLAQDLNESKDIIGQQVHSLSHARLTPLLIYYLLTARHTAVPRAIYWTGSK